MAEQQSWAIELRLEARHALEASHWTAIRQAIQPGTPRWVRSVVTPYETDGTKVGTIQVALTAATDGDAMWMTAELAQRGSQRPECPQGRRRRCRHTGRHPQA